MNNSLLTINRKGIEAALWDEPRSACPYNKTPDERCRLTRKLSFLRACAWFDGYDIGLNINYALVVDDPWIDMLLDGSKPWEMRSTRTHKRGWIALIRKGSGLIVGATQLVDSLPKQSYTEMLQNRGMHQIPANRLLELELWRHPWVTKTPVRFDKPVPYSLPQGAVSWVKIGTNRSLISLNGFK